MKGQFSLASLALFLPFNFFPFFFKSEITANYIATVSLHFVI